MQVGGQIGQLAAGFVGLAPDGAAELADHGGEFGAPLAGFPADRRTLRGDRFDLKDLWGSDGRLTGVVWANTAAAVIESTVPAARGESGGPLYGDFDGRKHIVIGLHQGIRGNGIDVSESAPNIHVLFTPGTLAAIRAAQVRTPCE